MAVMFCIMGGSVELSSWHDVQFEPVIWDKFLREGVTRHVIGCEDDVSMLFVIKKE